MSASDARSHRPVYRSEFSVFPPLNYTKYQFSIVIAIFNEWEKNVGCSHVGALCRDRSGANAAGRTFGSAFARICGERFCLFPVCCGWSVAAYSYRSIRSSSFGSADDPCCGVITRSSSCALQTVCRCCDFGCRSIRGARINQMPWFLAGQKTCRPELSGGTAVRYRSAAVAFSVLVASMPSCARSPKKPG